jgi:predicted type IV restriction endonuclease
LFSSIKSRYLSIGQYGEKLILHILIYAQSAAPSTPMKLARISGASIFTENPRPLLLPVDKLRLEHHEQYRHEGKAHDGGDEHTGRDESA